jgi:hypothetical protein
MALILILLAFLGFALASFGSSGGSSSSGTVTLAPTKCVQRAGAETTPPHCPPPANP